MPKVSTVYELKMEKTKSIAFDRVYDHQVSGLRMAKYAGLYHKIADTTMSFGGTQRFNKPKPYDCQVIVGAEAYVVIMFYIPRQKKTVYMIDVDEWIKEKESSSRKSLTEDRARAISHKIVEL